jgi:predicted nucleic acid-binding Zn finger protein
MTATEIQKRNNRAQKLKVLKVDDTNFYVESSEGKIMYHVEDSHDHMSCTCGDYARNVKTDATFMCKHILAVINATEADLEQAELMEKKKPRHDERFITTIEGHEFVKYPGLLDLGHQKGIMKIEVDPIQIPSKENDNMAICKALIVSKTGEEFSDIGDANPSNCSSRVVKHLLRMASTRSIARALRSYTNIGMTCLEELADFSEVINGKPPREKIETKRRPPVKPRETVQEKPVEQKEASESKKEADKPKEEGPQERSAESVTTPLMSEAQKRAIYNLSRRRGISVEKMETMVSETYKRKLEELTSKDASAFIRTLQQAA